jgi:RNA polymerase sigma factor (TIGR02999 family)
MSEFNHIILRLESGDPQAAEQLLPLVYGELRKLAAAKLAQEKPGQTLQPTALVHEAYLRLIGSNGASSTWDSRIHFLAAAATAMRRILIDRARYKKRLIHGGGRVREELNIDLPIALDRDERLLELDSALRKLAEVDSVKATLVELRYFVGLTGDQAARVMDISPSSADRHWTYARAWLRREMEGKST